MAFDEQFRGQTALLVRVLPFIAEENCFALKGGTAINLFVRDMPRLSVDIDLTYVPITSRKSSLREIEAALRRVAKSIERGISASQVLEGILQPEQTVDKLFVRSQGVQIKVEVNPVIRGCVHQPNISAVSLRVEELFGFAEIQVVSFPDLYAGKIVAALDRQHPRDLFDVRDLLSHEGINDDLRDAFIVYLLSSNQPLGKILAPNRLDITQEFERGLSGMTESPINLDTLIDTRDRLISTIVEDMPQSHRDFLASFECGKPNWALLINLPGIEDLPAILWRQINLNKVSESGKQALVKTLSEVFDAATD